MRVPNGAWRPDTVITDKDGNEIYVLLDQTNEMRSYEAIFGDLEGRKLCCVKRHVRKAFWRDGFYICTYRPNFAGQRPLKERDVDNKKLFPFSYLEITPMKGSFSYKYFDNTDELDPPRLIAENSWLGFMNVCCTPLIRCGKWSAAFRRTRGPQKLFKSDVYVDQWTNTVTAGPNQDLLASLCLAYIFDRVQCQPMITGFGLDDDEYDEQGAPLKGAGGRDDISLDSDPDMDASKNGMEMENLPAESTMSQRHVREEREQMENNYEDSFGQGQGDQYSSGEESSENRIV